MMKHSLHMSRHLRPNVSPEEGRDVRARAWTYVFQCFYRRNGKETVEPAPEPEGHDEAKEWKHG
jgi:hypothetical protein